MRVSENLWGTALTEVTGEEKGLCSRGPLLKNQAVVGLPLNAEAPVAARELVEASLGFLQLEELLLQQLIPSNHTEHTEDRMNSLENPPDVLLLFAFHPERINYIQVCVFWGWAQNNKRNWGKCFSIVLYTTWLLNNDLMTHTDTNL